MQSLLSKCNILRQSLQYINSLASLEERLFINEKDINLFSSGFVITMLKGLRAHMVRELVCEVNMTIYYTNILPRI